MAKAVEEFGATPPAPGPVLVIDVAPVREIKGGGGGYYDLIEDGEVVGRVRGKAKAEAWLD